MKVMAMALGGSVALPESVFARIAEPFDISQLGFFNEVERDLVAVLAETIIPRTDTPGAIDAGVPGWIELLVQDCFAPADQQVMKDGLVDLEKRSRDGYGKAFGALEVKGRIALLTAMEREKFIGSFKELTKFCFVNSEVGATQAFDFMMVPGRWEPGMELKPGQKAFAL